MTNNELVNQELKQVKRLLEIGLPSYFRGIGIFVALATLLYLMGNKFFDYDIEYSKEFLKSLILIAGFVAVIAIDKNPDERYIQIRGQAFTIAFLFAGITGLLLPWFSYIVDIIQGNEVVFVDNTAFVPLFTMFFCFLLYSSMLKRFS